MLNFGKIIHGAFLERPNRFLVKARLRNGRKIKAFMPNPGRLQELLLPEAKLYLTRNSDTASKTDYTVLAVQRDKNPVFLHTHLNNKVARYLIENNLVSYFRNCQIERAEVPYNHSRFDFLLNCGDKKVYLEVKSCTLFGNSVAMFPDAITARGRRHMLELAEMSIQGIKTSVMFVIHNPDIRYFMPDYHTDLDFSRTFLEVRHDLTIIPVSIGWTENLEIMQNPKIVDIPWDYIQRETHDRGAYLLLIKMRESQKITIGSLGEIHFNQGWYIYIGSAMKNLSARLNRHLNIRKKKHWHIDWLRESADKVIALPVRSSKRLECNLAIEMLKFFNSKVDGFGASDCKCDSHLFYSENNPLDMDDFHKKLMKYRMASPID